MIGDHLREKAGELDLLWVLYGCCRVEVQVFHQGRMLLHRQLQLSGDVQNTAEIHRERVTREAWTSSRS